MSEETIDKPSHFCGYAFCNFGKTTMLPAAGVFISSVGEYRPLAVGPFQKIGYDRLYESFVFRWTTSERCTIPDCHCGGIPTSDNLQELESLGANTRDEAIANHWKLVEKYRGG